MGVGRRDRIRIIETNNKATDSGTLDPSFDSTRQFDSNIYKKIEIQKCPGGSRIWVRHARPHLRFTTQKAATVKRAPVFGLS